MSADKEEQELFLLIEREQGLFLQRVDKKSMALLQEFSLGITEELLSCLDMAVTEDGVVLIMNNGRIYYAEKQSDSYEITVNCDMSSQDFFQNRSWDRYAYEYKDGRLAFVWNDSKDGYWYDCCNSVYVFVLEAEEIKFMAYYENSLDQADMNYDYSNKLHPAQAYQVCFE